MYKNLIPSQFFKFKRDKEREKWGTCKEERDDGIYKNTKSLIA